MLPTKQVGTSERQEPVRSKRTNTFSPKARNPILQEHIEVEPPKARLSTTQTWLHPAFLRPRIRAETYCLLKRPLRVAGLCSLPPYFSLPQTLLPLALDSRWSGLLKLVGYCSTPSPCLFATPHSLKSPNTDFCSPPTSQRQSSVETKPS